MGKRAICVLAVLAAAAWIVPAAAASEIISDRNIRNVTLKVDARGYALVQYTTEQGRRRNVLFWGAVNAVANPDEGRAQARFRVDYSGGWGAFRRPSYWRTFRNACRRYDGPRLYGLLVACKAPDGSYWALQQWVRLEAMRGFAPFNRQHTAVETHISHWTGPLPVLEVWPRWTYRASAQGFFGRLTYGGKPVYGTRSPSPTVSDPFARNVYIDTLNSIYGPGWKRDTAINTHRRNGAFCYTFTPQSPPRGYPSREPRGPGLGDRHRLTVMGPGVTPIVRWEGPRLGAFDPLRAAEVDAVFDRVLAGDAHCARER